MSWFSWIGNLVVKFFSNAFKDWRRDQELKEKGALEQREENLDELAVRRKAADEERRRIAEGGEIVGDDEL